jgi:hypothetical protein
MAANLPTLSHQYAWEPAAAEFVLDAYSRISIRGRQLTPEHLIEARRSANFILGDWSNTPNSLWKIGNADIAIALTPNTAGFPPPGIITPGLESFPLPIDTADLLDCYLRTFTPNAGGTSIGNTLDPVLDFLGNPIVNPPFGDVQLAGLGSGVLSSTAGSQYINVNWPSHGLSPLYPIFWGNPVWVGGVILPIFSIVSSVVDSNNVTIMAPVRALSTSVGQGMPPLFQTTAGSQAVNCFLPGHNLQVGATFNIAYAVDVGGLALIGSYTVASVTPNPYGQASYQFTFNVAVNAPSSGVAFANNGQIAVSQQAIGQLPTDIFLWPISRNDYAMQPLKDSPGNPTSYWFNRTIIPEVRVWPVAPATQVVEVLAGNPFNAQFNPQFGGGAPTQASSGPFLGFIGYRMKDIQVLNPGMGQNVDVPRRFYQAFVAALCAAVAEKYAGALFAEKKALADEAFQKAVDNDREKVTLTVQPEMMAYFN